MAVLVLGVPAWFFISREKEGIKKKYEKKEKTSKYMLWILLMEDTWPENAYTFQKKWKVMI